MALLPVIASLVFELLVEFLRCSIRRSKWTLHCILPRLPHPPPAGPHVVPAGHHLLLEHLNHIEFVVVLTNIGLIQHAVPVIYYLEEEEVVVVEEEEEEEEKDEEEEEEEEVALK